jgi:hypothetical protein
MQLHILRTWTSQGKVRLRAGREFRARDMCFRRIALPFRHRGEEITTDVEPSDRRVAARRGYSAAMTKPVVSTKRLLG